MSKDWLKENVTSVIAISFTFMFFIAKGIILFGNLKISETILVQIESSFDNMEIMVLGYFFGASKKGSGTIEAAKEVNINTEGK